MKQIDFRHNNLVLTTAAEIEDLASAIRFEGSKRAYTVRVDGGGQRHAGTEVNRFASSILADAKFSALFEVTEMDVLKTSDSAVMEYLITLGLASSSHKGKGEYQFYTLPMARAIIYKMVVTQNKLDWRRVDEWLDPILKDNKEVYVYHGPVNFEKHDVSKKKKVTTVPKDKKLPIFRKGE